MSYWASPDAEPSKVMGISMGGHGFHGSKALFCTAKLEDSWADLPGSDRLGEQSVPVDPSIPVNPTDSYTISAKKLEDSAITADSVRFHSTGEATLSGNFDATPGVYSCVTF
jgi:hypothetical protein